MDLNKLGGGEAVLLNVKALEMFTEELNVEFFYDGEKQEPFILSRDAIEIQLSSYSIASFLLIKVILLVSFIMCTIMSIISVMYWCVSLKYVNSEGLVVEWMCKCTCMPVQRRITVEEWKLEPSVEINRDVEDSLLKPALKK